MVKRMGAALVALLVVAFLMTGCMTVGEADRQVESQNVGAAERIGVTAEAAKEAVKAGNADAATAALDDIIQTAGDVRRNSENALASWGGSDLLKNRQPYSPAASKEARDAQKVAHEKPWYIAIWGSAWTYLVTGLTFLAGVLKYASKIPVIGTWLGGPLGSALADVLQRVASLAVNADANGDGKVDATDIKMHLADLRADPKLRPYIDKALHAAHLDFLVHEQDATAPEPEPPPPSATVAPAT